jgi:teichuronic acid biosynthesis glycosyltransferase TuaC
VHVLAVTNMYPSAAKPALGTFVASQVESLRGIGVDIDVLHVDRAGRGRGVYRRLPRELSAAVDERSPDVVHVMYGGVMADVVTRAIRDRPVLVSFCGSDILGAGAGGPLSRVSSRYGVVCSRRAAHQASGIVVKSRNLVDALPGDILSDRVWVVPNGVDFAQFRPLDRTESLAAAGWDPGRIHILFGASPGRPEKRFELARVAVERLGDERVELHTLDGLRHADVPSVLNAASVLLLTSTHEGSPNVVKEALACNLAVVSVDVGDVSERLAGIEGCYLAEATPEDLAAKLRAVLERSARVQARDRIRDLSVENVARSLASVYAELVS